MTIPKAIWDSEDPVHLISITRVRTGPGTFRYVPISVEDGLKTPYAATVRCDNPDELIAKYEYLASEMNKLYWELEYLWDLPSNMRPNKQQKLDYIDMKHLGCPNWPNCDTEGCGEM